MQSKTIYLALVSISCYQVMQFLLKAFIPLENEVDSLNASVAAGILTYELRRKILSKDLKKNNELNPNLVTLG